MVSERSCPSDYLDGTAVFLFPPEYMGGHCAEVFHLIGTEIAHKFVQRALELDLDKDGNAENVYSCYEFDRSCVFTGLVSHLYEQNDMGQLARDAVLLILLTSAEDNLIAEFIASKSSFCDIVALGLSGFFSELPCVLESEDCGNIVPDLGKLNNYKSSLHFCNAVIQAAHPTVADKICSLLYSGFLEPVVKPALLQEDNEAVAASTVYLNMCLVILSQPPLIKTIVRMLLFECDENGEPLVNVIVKRIQGRDKLASVSVQLLDMLLRLVCEDVTFMLVLRDLLPLPYDEQQFSTICSSSYSQDIATRLLACVPACMLNVEEMHSPNTLNIYIREGSDLVNSFANKCSDWKWRYDGKTPNPSAFQPDSCEKPNISILGIPFELTNSHQSTVLDAILSQLEALYDHSFTYNLRLASLLATLTAYPLPILVNHLFYERSSQDKPNLIEILTSLKKKIDELTANINGLDGWVKRILRALNTEKSHSNRDRSLSPIQLFVRNSRLGSPFRRKSAETSRNEEQVKNIIHSAIILANLVQLLAGIILHHSVAVVRP